MPLSLRWHMSLTFNVPGRGLNTADITMSLSKTRARHDNVIVLPLPLALSLFQAAARAPTSRAAARIGGAHCVPAIMRHVWLDNNDIVRYG